ncbi:MAG: precorrin-6Y C5,15-methyltransferase (decarboxylating) subunit CbiT [Candidatus Bathyarchaeota archaeon]|nr:precorrin-6Y C5,15-methyltransferase (decarboxylating) subunit CbiT [Candidatus Bathyarchaeota archaeon]
MWNCRTPGIPDELFLQKDDVIGPTKEEIRVLSISKARLREGSVVADVGCGTGGLTVEAALQVTATGKVFAIDEDAEAVKLTAENASRFGVQQTVQLMLGKAPEALSNLPQLDAVLVGGSHALREVIRAVHKKLKKNGRIVINAILLETGYAALDEVRKLGFSEVDVITVSVAKGKEVNTGTMMLARNPITIVSATKV